VHGPQATGLALDTPTQKLIEETIMHPKTSDEVKSEIQALKELLSRLPDCKRAISVSLRVLGKECESR
jgi:biotin synthase-related radical SAM superfamily protein